MYYINIFIVLLTVKLAFSLICQEVLKMPEDKQLNLFELQTMHPTEISSCLTHLGRQDMPEAEAKFIWNSLIQFYNGVANIPEDVLSVLHYVSVAIQPEEYLNITISNIDVVRNFGSNYGLKENQLEAIAEKVREDFGAKEPEDYTFYDLEALRQILCAFNRSEIERIRPKAYTEAASVIGNLKNCNSEVMKGFAGLATHRDAFGSPARWTNMTVRIIGSVAEHLPSDVLSRLRTRISKATVIGDN